MVDFSKLLKKPAGEAQAPSALPVGDYLGMVKGWAPVEAPAGKEYSAMIRFTFALRDWPEDTEDADKVNPDGTEIDLSKRQLRRDFYDNRLDILDDFIRSLGVDMAGRSYEEVLPETIGCEVVVPVQQYINRQTGAVGNQVGNPKGTAEG